MWKPVRPVLTKFCREVIQRLHILVSDEVTDCVRLYDVIQEGLVHCVQPLESMATVALIRKIHVKNWSLFC